jgi:hypothetical protein
VRITCEAHIDDAKAVVEHFQLQRLDWCIRLLCGASLSGEAAIWVFVDLIDKPRQAPALGDWVVSVPAHVCPLPEKAPLASPPNELELRDIDLGMARRSIKVRASLKHGDIVALDPVLETKLLPQIRPSAPLAQSSN